MNGMATVYPRHVPNICWCGHDYREHTITVAATTSVCNQCLAAVNGLPSEHLFTSRDEGWPKTQFPRPQAKGYYASGSWQLWNPSASLSAPGTFLTVTTQAVAGTNEVTCGNWLTFGSFTWPGNTWQFSLNQRLIGASVMFRGLANPQRTDMYRIANIIGTNFPNRTLVLTTSLRQSVNTNVGVWLYGADGGMSGPAMPANNQRAG